LRSAVEKGRAPGDIGDDNVFALLVGRMEVLFEGGKVFPVLRFRVP
jgi:hypothetical protein